METKAYQSVLQALELSHSSANNEQINRATKMIESESAKQGYLPILVNIINDPNISQSLAYAALVQLKNTLRARWSIDRKQKGSICHNDRQYLLSWLIQTNINHSSNFAMFTLIKDVNQKVADSVQQLMPKICQLLHQQQYLKACLNILLGISEYYRYDNSYNQRLIFIEFLEASIPLLIALVHKGEQKIVDLYWKWNNDQTRESLRIFNTQKAYIKFACKSICRELSPSLRTLYCHWATIAQSRLDQENEEYNQNAKKNPKFCGNRGTNQFNYFHAKKWSAKFFVKFLSVLIVVKDSQPQLARIRNQYFDEYGVSLKQTLHSNFKQSRPNHIRFFELAFLQSMFNLSARLMKSQLQYYLFQILPSILLVSEQDLNNIQYNPSEFIISQSITQKNIRTYATDIWCNLALFDSTKIASLNVQIKQGQYIVESYRHLYKWLLQQDWRTQEIALYLMASSGLKISQFKQTSQIACDVLNLCIPQIFDQPLLVLQVRGFQLIHNLTSLINKQSYPVIQDIILNVFQKRKHESKFDLLAIYAGTALEKIIYYGVETIRRFNSQQIKLVLSTLLQLIKIYQISELSKTLVLMIEEYSEQMSMFSIEIICFMSKIFKQNVDKSLQTGMVEYSPSDSTLDVLTIMSRIQTKDPYFAISLKQTLQDELVYLLNYVLSYEEQLPNQYLQILLQILSSLIDSQTGSLQCLPGRLNYYFLIVVLKLAPPNSNIIDKVQHSAYTQQQRLLIKQCTKVNELTTQLVFELFRNYLKFINPTQVVIKKAVPEVLDSLFTEDLINQFLYLLYYFYKPFKQLQFYQICKGRYLVTVLLTCIMEHHQSSLPNLFYMKAFSVIKANSKSLKTVKYLKNSNMQLFCIWLCCYPDALNYMNKSDENILQFILALFFANKHELNKITNELQIKRIILGMTSLVRFGIVYVQIKSLYQLLFNWIFYFVDKTLAKDDEDDEASCPPPFSQILQKQFGLGEDFFSCGRQLQYIVDQTYKQEYTPKHIFSEFDCFLQTLLYLQCKDPNSYSNYVLKCHFYQLKSILEGANLQYLDQYKDLLVDKEIDTNEYL